ncbi:MAG: peptidyl-prolyl cis-trans isomerase [Tannerella sp.]|nr:peptidyl-prolyl cis-trans isomerase [Tannerella sp.]
MDQASGDVVVRVKDRTFTRGEIDGLIPKGISSADSLIRAEAIVKKWAIDVLTDDAAYQNMGDDKAEIDRLVNEYRRSLMRYRYQERIIRDKVSATISDYDQVKYYEENKPQFILSENLIKGLFIKVPAGAPGLENVRKWYVSDSEESLEKIEKYGIRNAIIYDYFYDHWVNFDEVMAKIPQRLSNPTRFLMTNHHLEVSDSTHVYFLNISDKSLISGVAPFDYVKSRIHEILVNKRKIEYLRVFGENLYRDAVKNGTVKFITE